MSEDRNIGTPEEVPAVPGPGEPAAPQPAGRRFGRVLNGSVAGIVAAGVIGGLVGGGIVAFVDQDGRPDRPGFHRQADQNGPPFRRGQGFDRGPQGDPRQNQQQTPQDGQSGPSQGGSTDVPS
ncbi:hypothetical protein [Actinocorallia lasiicapitis]